MRMVVVLPAPSGTNQAEHLASGRPRATARGPRRIGPYRFETRSSVMALLATNGISASTGMPAFSTPSRLSTDTLTR